MPTLYDKRSEFENRLNALRDHKHSQLDEAIQELREQMLQQVKPTLPEDIAQRLKGVDEDLRQRVAAPQILPRPAAQGRVEMGDTPELRHLDDTFIQVFELERHYPADKLRYPTVYCESLEEFFTAMVSQSPLSAAGRQAELRQLVEETQQTAKETEGGGIFGYNLPGNGCYLNGWLFAYGRNITPRAAFQEPHLLASILETAMHEKLGHGFLSVYSAVGQVKTSLGLGLAELAGRFGIKAADDPIASLRSEQAGLIGLVSRLLEEGYATWLETYLGARIFQGAQHPRHDLNKIVQAIKDLPPAFQQRQEIQAALLEAIGILFGRQDANLDAMHQAVMVLEVVGGDLDDYFGSKLGQPLRYAVGEMLFMQAEANLGALCVPYAALIAANVTFDPAQIGVVDLRHLLSQDARLNPDARMARISRMRLNKSGDVAELARRVESELSISIPPELKK